MALSLIGPRGRISQKTFDARGAPALPAPCEPAEGTRPRSCSLPRFYACCRYASAPRRGAGGGANAPNGCTPVRVRTCEMAKAGLRPERRRAELEVRECLGGTSGRDCRCSGIRLAPSLEPWNSVRWSFPVTELPSLRFVLRGDESLLQSSSSIPDSTKCKRPREPGALARFFSSSIGSERTKLNIFGETGTSAAPSAKCIQGACSRRQTVRHALSRSSCSRSHGFEIPLTGHPEASRFLVDASCAVVRRQAEQA